MPYSTPIGKDEIKKLLQTWVPSPRAWVIDLGCGAGAYGKLLAETQCHIIGVDAVDYRAKFRLRRFYDKVLVHDIRDEAFLKMLGHFDIAIAGDVLEHMATEEAQAVLATMQEIADKVLVALPYEYEQHTGNKWEDHVQDDLTPGIVKKRYPSLTPIHIYGTGGVPEYGYYTWERQVKK